MQILRITKKLGEIFQWWMYAICIDVQKIVHTCGATAHSPLVDMDHIKTNEPWPQRYILIRILV